MKPSPSSDDAQVMTSPVPAAKPRMPLVVKLMILGFVAAITAAVVAAAISASGQKDRSGTPEYLCDLLRSGWTAGELASGDVWQEWPENQSAISRGIDLTSAADAGGCGALV